MQITLWDYIVRAAFAVFAIALLIIALNWTRHPGRRAIDRGGSHAKKIGTMDLILIVVGVVLLVFTITMIVLYVRTGNEPSTLITCVFATLGGECGIMGWIKTNKQRYQDRKWQKEDLGVPAPDKPPDEEDFPTNNL